METKPTQVRRITRCSCGKYGTRGGLCDTHWRAAVKELQRAEAKLYGEVFTASPDPR